MTKSFVAIVLIASLSFSFYCFQLLLVIFMTFQIGTTLMTVLFIMPNDFGGQKNIIDLIFQHKEFLFIFIKVPICIACLFGSLQIIRKNNKTRRNLIMAYGVDLFVTCLIIYYVVSLSAMSNYQLTEMTVTPTTAKLEEVWTDNSIYSFIKIITPYLIVISSFASALSIRPVRNEFL
jgi:hypothetical protein